MYRVRCGDATRLDGRRIDLEVLSGRLCCVAERTEPVESGEIAALHAGDAGAAGPVAIAAKRFALENGVEMTD